MYAVGYGMAVLDVLQPGLHGLRDEVDGIYHEMRTLLEQVELTAKDVWDGYMR